ncbi:hypothetical protein [Nocardioides kribbensis]|uniref:Uncharacterized protein n=1 Tax=Nocardioides kribbensis TaxID=305517 RepID=A0ABV1NYH2_9ACTN
MRRRVLIVLAALVALLAVGSAMTAAGGGSSVTRPRLERSLPAVFAHVYAQQAHLQGRDGVTAASVHAVAMCDKHGPDVADVGPGGDWVCLMSWQDPDVPMPPEGYGKFELNVHSNDCYTASGPSKLTGFLTMTDTSGREVTNPAFEFDGCFDPGSDDTPTGSSFPSLLAVTSTSLTPAADGTVSLTTTCGTGSEGCSGRIVAAAGGRRLGSLPYDMKEESTATLVVPRPLPATAGEATFTVEPRRGVGPTGPITLATP